MNEQPASSQPIDAYASSHSAGEIAKGSFLVADLRRAARVHHASHAPLDSSRQLGSNQAHVMLIANASDAHAAALADGILLDEVVDSLLNAVPLHRSPSPALPNLHSEAHLQRELKGTFERCDEELRESGQVHAPATSMTLSFVRWPMMFVVHAGNSRAYLLRNGQMHRLTKVHTIAQRMVDQGKLDPAAADSSGFASMLWNAVGGPTNVSPEMVSEMLQPGDTVLLCSEGLTSCVSDALLREVLSSAMSAQDACQSLTGLVRSIAPDRQVTVAVARFEATVHEARTLPVQPTQRPTQASREITPTAVREKIPPAPAARARSRVRPRAR